MAIDVSRRGFVGGSAALAGGVALGGPMSALARASRARARRSRSYGYGQLRPTPEIDSGTVYLELPPGFKYRLISRQGDPMDDGNPTPGIFDGMAAYPGRGGTHDPDPQPREPLARRRDHGAGADRQALRPGRQRPRRQHQAGGRQRPPAGGELRGARRHAHQLRRRRHAVGHVDHLRGDLQLRLDREQRHARHRRAARLLLRGRRRRQRPGERRSRSSTAGRFSHEAVAWSTARSTRPRTAATRASTASSRAPAERPATWRRFGGKLEALVVQRAGRTSTSTPPTRARPTRSSG